MTSQELDELVEAIKRDPELYAVIIRDLHEERHRLIDKLHRIVGDMGAAPVTTARYAFEHFAGAFRQWAQDVKIREITEEDRKLIDDICDLILGEESFILKVVKA